MGMFWLLQKLFMCCWNLFKLASSSSTKNVSSYPSLKKKRVIIVANELPIEVETKTDGKNVSRDFDWDYDSLYIQLKNSLSFDDKFEFMFVGCLKEEIPLHQQEEVSRTLLETYNCVPTFVPSDLYYSYYHCFCKKHLWPVLHDMLPYSPKLGILFKHSLWQNYISANQIFADKILKIIEPENDYVWVHDYHLMVLPGFLRKEISNVKLGFFLHNNFPSVEIFKSLSIWKELVLNLLDSALVGFQTYDYGTKFLSCCELVNESYVLKNGCIEYCGRKVNIRIMPTGIHMGRLKSVMKLPETEAKIAELTTQFNDMDRIMILAVDDLDIFKGIHYNLLAMEKLLDKHPQFRGRVVLVQIVNPPRSEGKTADTVQAETCDAVTRINEEFGTPQYQPIVLVDAHLEFYEKMAYCATAVCLLVTGTRDGMNLMPYTYTMCRDMNKSKESMLILSEFIGCSSLLGGAIRVIPSDVDEVTERLVDVLRMPESDKQIRHEKHCGYIRRHDIGRWGRNFLHELEMSCGDPASNIIVESDLR